MMRVGRIRPSGSSAAPYGLFAGALVCLISTVTFERNATSTLVSAILCVIFVGLGSAVVASRGSVGAALARGTFGTWASLWVALAFGLASISWRQIQVGTPAQISPHYVVVALILVAVAWTCWTIGYALPLGGDIGNRLSGILAGNHAREITTSRVLLLYGIGLTGQVSKVFTNGFGYLADPAAQISSPSAFGQVISLLSTFGNMAVGAAAYLAFSRNRRGELLLAVTLCLAQSAIGLASGDKEPVVLAVLALGFGYSAARGKLPLRLLAVSLVVFIALIIPFNAAYRNVVRGSGATLSEQDALSQTPGILLDSVAGRAGATPGTANPATTLFLRIREIDSVAITVQKTPSQIGYTSPGQFAVAPVLGVVPRALWPSKPVLDGGYQFTQQYFGGSDSYTSTAVTPMADLYRHGGYTVLLLGMATLGIAYRAVDAAISKIQDVRYLFFVIAGFSLFVKLEEDAVAFMASLVAILLAPAIAGCLLKHRHAGVGSANGTEVGRTAVQHPDSSMSGTLRP